MPSRPVEDGSSMHSTLVRLQFRIPKNVLSTEANQD